MAVSGSVVGKPGVEEHLTFRMFKDNAKCWHISGGKLRLYEEGEISSEDNLPAVQSKNKVN